MNIAKQFLSGLVVIGMLFLPILDVRAQQKSKVPQPLLPCETCGGELGGGYVPPSIPPTINTSVAQQTQIVATNVQAHIYLGHFYPTDAASFATALQFQFANWDEVGFTTILQNWILTNSALYTTTPTSQQLQTGYNALVSLGINVTYSQYANTILGQPLTVRQQFIQLVKTYGLKVLHATIVQELQAEAAVASRVLPKLQTASARFKNTCDILNPDMGAGYKTFKGIPQLQGVGFLLVGSGPPWLTIAGLYLGIVALAIGTLAGGPVAWGIAAAGVAIGGAGLLMGC
jgi:hypothetical protein